MPWALIGLAPMDLNKAVADLRRRRDEVNQAIDALERLGSHGQVRRGRPSGRIASDQPEDQTPGDGSQGEGSNSDTR